MRLIDADELMATIKMHDYPLRGHYNSTDRGMWTAGIQQAIDEAPTIDAVPVVHGRWEKRKEDTLIHWDCTQCGIGFLDDIGLDKLHYCPNCGAKMDLED
ncbi:hypothetical protein [Gehongia tenuis]|uniref:Uncharacterized protein n=1 Tax=Gehongia tenuis TaxID=2763655 RepID=A0A926D6C0_9FIRM|nr:hypothetical protein [Gehongia tenuis]MBC8532252.1 hypothetical protein [Gehongia tenuis]